MSIFKGIKNHLLNIIYPNDVSCLICDQDLDFQEKHRYGLCNECNTELDWIKGRTCKACGGPLPEFIENDTCYNCEKQVSYLTDCVACFGYSGLGKDLIMDLKYNRKTYLGIALSEMLGDVIIASFPHEIDVIVSVPLHSRRLAERGFNQMDLIGEPLSAKLGISYSKAALVRRKNTPRLKNLDRHDRKAIMDGLFLANKEHVLGKSVLLIDDIYTTGATMNACAKSLLDSGALNVYGAVLSVNFRD